MEYLDIVDENGIPTGEKIERSIAHKTGVRHRTSHLWLVRKRDEHVQVLIQKRCLTKDSHPGCYDISSAGHIPAGSDFVPSALRELSEELGVSATAEELIFCGLRRYHHKNVFHGKTFSDHQVSAVYILWRDIPEEQIHCQPSEIESVRWIDLDELYEKLENNLIPSCIRTEELDMIKQKLKG